MNILNYYKIKKCSYHFCDLNIKSYKNELTVLYDLFIIGCDMIKNNIDTSVCNIRVEKILILDLFNMLVVVTNNSTF